MTALLCGALYAAGYLVALQGQLRLDYSADRALAASLIGFSSEPVQGPERPHR